MTQELISTLLNNIPRNSEEEGDFYSVTTEELTHVLCSQNKISLDVARNTIKLIENLLDTLGLLNPIYLQKKEWSFVSFPSQLFAMSLLTAMSQKESYLFSSQFWNTQSISNDKKNKHRDILNYIENQRVINHTSQNAEPIRYIYVSWGIIKLDDKIILCQREDTHKRYDKSAGDYGLIGGRLNQYDIHTFLGDMRDRLCSLQSNNLIHTNESFANTLKRELHEEVGLFFDIHYTFNLWRSLKPYRQIQGSAPNHAYTKYHFEIYHIKLTLEGYLFLKQQLQSNEHLVWFSIDEVVEGKSTDGKIAYVNALINDFDMDKHELKTELFKLQESFIANYSCQPLKPNDYALTIPIISESSILFGFKGKEKPIDVKLSERQLSILLGLSSHSRRFEFESPSNKIVLHPYNWIEVKNDESLQRELLELVKLFQSLPFKIENHKDKLFRLSIDPSIIYFDDKCFLYSVSLNDLKGIKSKIEVSLTRLPMQTAFGVTRLVKEYFNISLKLASGLQNLSDKSSPSDNPKAEKIEDNYSKTILKEARFQSLGLKNLVRREKGLIKFCVNVAKI